MNYLDDKIAEITHELEKQIESGQTIIHILHSLDLRPRCSAINREHLYLASELEAIFKIRQDQKEQFQHLLDIHADGRRINLNIYYPLDKVLDYFLPTLSHSLANLTYHCDEEGAR